MGNNLKTTALLGLLTGIILWIGSLWGQGGLTMALLFAGVMNFVSFFFSDKIALAMYRAQPVTREQLPEVYDTVERLCLRHNLPLPKLYLIPSESPNAFATGRSPKHASVAVTQGILRLLDREELEGVLAHELGHVQNRDILTSAVAATLAGAIMWIAHMAKWAAIFGGFGRDSEEEGSGGALGSLLLIFLAPIAAMLIQFAISRSREYQADATGAKLAGNPYALARALKKISDGSKHVPLPASPSTAHLFIVKPFSGRGLLSMFSTHPPVEKRIERLIGRTWI
ncbi:MAG: zinc metalloprotease HtpX [Acidobacteria bacterium]|nr:zinc metalloprotease HtpX [Acidobacteriota bacterium]